MSNAFKYVTKGMLPALVPCYGRYNNGPVQMCHGRDSRTIALRCLWNFTDASTGVCGPKCPEVTRSRFPCQHQAQGDLATRRLLEEVHFEDHAPTTGVGGRLWHSTARRPPAATGIVLNICPWTTNIRGLQSTRVISSQTTKRVLNR